MGWDGYFIGDVSCRVHFLSDKKNFPDTRWDGKAICIGRAFVKSQGWSVWKNSDGSAYATVDLMKKDKSGMVYVKSIDEASGPYYWDIPKALFEKLLSLPSEYASNPSSIEWRAKVSRTLEANAGAGRVYKAGDKILIRDWYHSGNKFEIVDLKKHLFKYLEGYYIGGTVKLKGFKKEFIVSKI